jgi:acetyl-CoA carboxylase biotin carboxyl carrier protein
MNVDQLKQILDMVREHDLAEFEFEHDGVKIRIKKTPSGYTMPSPAPAPALPAIPPSPAPAPVGPPPAAGPVSASRVETPATPEGVELAVVKSPIVGTFYRAPEPGAPSFVEIGDQVKKGKVLCIIEAMKLMNEIESEYDGEVVSIYVENGQPVQYGERLFAVRVK